MEKDPPNPAQEKQGDFSSTTTTPTSTTAPPAKVESPTIAAQTPPASPPGQPPAGTRPVPPTPPSAEESHSNWVHRWSNAIPVGIFLVLAVLFVKVAITLVDLIYPLPYPTRMYLAVSAGGAVLVFAGLFFLIILIPAASKFLKSELRTELYSVRASSLCVIAGLMMFGIVAIGLVLAQIIQVLRRP